MPLSGLVGWKGGDVYIYPLDHTYMLVAYCETLLYSLTNMGNSAINYCIIYPIAKN